MIVIVDIEGTEYKEADHNILEPTEKTIKITRKVDLKDKTIEQLDAKLKEVLQCTW